MWDTVLVLLGCCAAFVCGFEPTGQFDLGPADIKELCTLVDGSPPPDHPGCVYFEWTRCAQTDTDPSRPCGWYQMKRCPENGRKKRDADHVVNFEQPEGIWGPDPHLEDMIDPENKGIPHISWPVRVR